MKLVFSFDDGRDDFIKSALTLNKYNLVGSFHITTGFIDGSFATDAFGIGRKPLSINELKTMKEMGMDVSSHGDKHITEYKDFINSYNKLQNWLDLKGKIGLSVPNSDFTDEQLNDFENKLSDKLTYVRVGRSPKCYSVFGKISYVLYHLLHWQVFFNKFNKSNLIKEFDKNKIVSLVVKKDTKVKHLVNFIDKYKNENCVLVLMFHSVVENPTNTWEYSEKQFDELCSFVSKNQIKTYTLEELANGK